MKIDLLAIKKICIAQTGLDPHNIYNYISPYTINKLQRMLTDIQAQYADNPPLVEHEVSNLIERMFNSGKRERRQSFLLFKLAKDKGLISQSSQDKLMVAMSLPMDKPKVMKQQQISTPVAPQKPAAPQPPVATQPPVAATQPVAPPVPPVAPTVPAAPPVEKQEDIFDVLMGKTQPRNTMVPQQ